MCVLTVHAIDCEYFVTTVVDLIFSCLRQSLWALCSVFLRERVTYILLKNGNIVAGNKVMKFAEELCS